MPSISPSSLNYSYNYFLYFPILSHIYFWRVLCPFSQYQAVPTRVLSRSVLLIILLVQSVWFVDATPIYNLISYMPITHIFIINTNTIILLSALSKTTTILLYPIYNLSHLFLVPISIPTIPIHYYYYYYSCDCD